MRVGERVGSLEWKISARGHGHPDRLQERNGRLTCLIPSIRLTRS